MVADGVPVEQVLRAAVLGGYALVVTTGGTGLTPDDLTPEATRAVIDREVPGIAEAIRAYGAAHGVPTAVLSRGLAGLAESTLIVNLAGSTGAVRDGLAVLGPILTHLLDQAGGQHGHAGDAPLEPDRLHDSRVAGHSHRRTAGDASDQAAGPGGLERGPFTQRGVAAPLGRNES